MFERVTYADLQFAGSRQEKSPGEEPDEGELTYENLQGPRAQGDLPPRATQGGKDQSLPQETPFQTGVTAAAQGLNTRKQQPAARTQSALVRGRQGCADLQASRQLQQASRDHTAEHHVLQASLEESQYLLHLTEEELNSTRVALWQSRVAENQTRRQLQHQERLLDQTNHSLAVLRSERESLKANLSHATSCRQIGCCPKGWKLFRWKCLWISDTWSTWDSSKQVCKYTSSQLLILKESWDAQDIWSSGSFEQSNHYWIGLRKEYSTFRWVDQSPVIGISDMVTFAIFFLQLPHCWLTASLLAPQVSLILPALPAAHDPRPIWWSSAETSTGGYTLSK
ncbi:B-cell differentiation antigen CD72-like isoform X3 [Crotalus tigris]|uniref:B-cell differentiation antigen CD72-like isoform X3 n=1 Tax=Crotalus tigris TaxID=88082 RepID=UPI00192F3FC9|nr:B-cell differentiation antigen CD72-like isoform X3 [Crotalus tigris]